MRRRRWRGSPKKRDIARALRKEPTPAERAAWRLLRNRGLLGLKFRRQHPIGGYVVDFYCPELRLALELDGGYHTTPEQADLDHQRSMTLAERRMRVVRVSSTEVSRATLMAALQPFSDRLRPLSRASGRGQG